MFQFRRFPTYAYFIQRTFPQRYLRGVSPFGYLRIYAYVQLPEAFRSLSRPSSAPDAKAFPLRSFMLDLSDEGLPSPFGQTFRVGPFTVLSFHFPSLKLLSLILDP